MESRSVREQAQALKDIFSSVRLNPARAEVQIPLPNTSAQVAKHSGNQKAALPCADESAIKESKWADEDRRIVKRGGRKPLAARFADLRRELRQSYTPGSEETR